MTISEFIRQLSTKIRFSYAEDFDNVGLLCGRPEQELRGVLVCHDALESVVQEAIEKGCNCIVAFHPIIFSGLKSITGKSYVERAVMLALENKIAIIAVHTAWDNDFYGVNHGIAKALGLRHLQVLIPKKDALSQLRFFVPVEAAEQVRSAIFATGAGTIGQYADCSFNIHGTGTFLPLEKASPAYGEVGTWEQVSEMEVQILVENWQLPAAIQAMKDAHPYEEVAYYVTSLRNENHHAGLGQFGLLDEEMSAQEFLSECRAVFDVPVIRTSSHFTGRIRKVAVLGGSGASGISAAKKLGCDAYVSSDFKYHDFFQGDENFLLADVGHFESERFVSQQLADVISNILPTFAVLKSETKTNPVNYFL